MPLHCVGAQNLATSSNVLLNGATSFSFSIWLKIASGTHPVPEDNNLFSTVYNGLTMVIPANTNNYFRSYILVNEGPSDPVDGNFADITLPFDVANHVVVAWTSGELRCYLNGILYADLTSDVTGEIGRLVNQDTPGPISLGSMTANLDLTIDEPTLWIGHVLSQSEVVALRDRTATPSSIAPGNIAWQLSLSGTEGATAQVGDPGLTDQGPNGLSIANVVGSPAYEAAHLIYTPPARVNSAQIGPSGQTLILWFTDPQGNPSNLQSIASDPTISINGGSAIQLANPIWGVTGSQQPAYLPYAIYPLPTTISAADAVTITASEGWATASVGQVAQPSALAADTSQIGRKLLPFADVPKTMSVGYNIGQPGCSQPMMPFANVARQMAGWYSGAGLSFGVGPDGYVTSIGSGSYVTAYVVLSWPDPVDSNNNYPTAPPDGIWTFVWTGTSPIGLDNLDGLTTISVPNPIYGTPTNGVNTAQIRITAGGGKRCPTFQLRAYGPLSDLQIYPPDPASPLTRSVDPSQKFHPDFLQALSGAKCLRFMDALGTNISSVVDFTDFAQEWQLSYAIARSYMGGAIASVGPYSNADGYFPQDQGIPILITTTTPHGIKEGQFLSISGLTGPNGDGSFTTTNPTGTVSLNGFGVLAHVVSPTEVALAQRLNGGLASTSATAIAQTFTDVGPSAIILGSYGTGWPLADCIDLCNAAGTDAWINVPHAATDACVTEMFQLIGSRLNPGLKVHCEYSNETWNYGAAFLQTGYCESKGAASNPPIDGNAWYVQRTGEVHALAAAALAEFGRDGDLIRTFGTQGGWWAGTGSWRVGYAAQLNLPVDELAIAPYVDSGPEDGTLGTTYDTLNQDQLMDIAEVWQPYDGSAAMVSGNLGVLAPSYPDAKVVCYEGGPQYGGLTGSGDLGARSRAWARHPRMRGIMLSFLQGLQDHGCALFNRYQYFGLVGAAWVANSAMWPDYVAWNEQAGLGDGSDGLFDNRTNYEALDKIVSVVGGAIDAWSGLIAPPSTPANLARWVPLRRTATRSWR